MDAQLRWFLCICFVYSEIMLGLNAQSTHESEGRECATPDGVAGICRQLPRCPHVVRAITRGLRQHSRCGFVGPVELVCCVADSAHPRTDRSPLNVQTTSTPPQSISRSAVSTVRTFVPLPYAENRPFGAELPVEVEENLPLTTISSRYNDIKNNTKESETVFVSNTNDTDTEDLNDRILLGNNNRNRVSPASFAINSFKNFISIFLGKPPTQTPVVPLQLHVLNPPDHTENALTESSTQYYPLYITPNSVLMHIPVSTPRVENTRPINVRPSSFTTPESNSELPTNVDLPIQTSPHPISKDTQYPTSSWQRPYTKFPSTPASFDVSPVYPVVFEATPMPDKFPNNAHITPWGEQPHLYEAPIPPQPAPPSSTPLSIENMQNLSVPTFTSSKELDSLTPSVRPELVLATLTTHRPEVLNRPPSELSSKPRPDVLNTSVGRKSKEACDRYKQIPKLTRYIIGGDYAAPGEFPHMVALGFQKPRQTNLSWLCGGTLLSEEYVLTAAHCVDTKYGRPRAVRVGFTNLTADWATGAEVALRGAAVHPDYSAAQRAHDVALLRLAAPLRFSDFVLPACLRADPAPPRGPLLVTGWGSVTPDGTTPTDLLKAAVVNPLDDETCRGYYPDVFRREMICAGSDDAVDTCKGDSGGPMQHLEGAAAAVFTVVGVTSFGPTPCAGALPGVYSRVASYLPWIESVVWPN